jgi:hypothetical protein
MRIAKKLPRNANDGRYNRPIDLLRAMTWHRFVKSSLGNASNYLLDKKFGGGQSRWTSYMNGSQPNELLLERVERQVNGSRDTYEVGPKGSKLWFALVSENESELNLIVKLGRTIDKSIAQFRLQVLNNKIEVWASHGTYDPHPYDCEIQYLNLELIQSELFSFSEPSNDNLNMECMRVTDQENGESTLVTKAIDLLLEVVQPYRKKSMDDAYAELVDSFSDQYYNLAWHKNLHSEMAFDDLRMGNVKSKGVKLRASVPPTAPAP